MSGTALLPRKVRIGTKIEAVLPVINPPSTKLQEDLAICQVDTPHAIVKLFWRIISQYRARLGTVADFGAGDGRFASCGTFLKYTGYEIDAPRSVGFKASSKKQIINGCAFDAAAGEFDAVIGNPPYLRHHKIESKWRDKISKRIEAALSIKVNQLCNFFAYFIYLAIIKTKKNGLIGLVVPYEWVSRPSLAPLREYIKAQKWTVAVYRFRERVFPDVLTTASITVIDKSGVDGSWAFYEIDKDFSLIPQKNASGTKYSVLQYSKRSGIWALRGLSPGTQNIFALTEAEREKHGLYRKKDVIPCVTSLKCIPSGKVTKLSDSVFEKYFVAGGRKCWLIRSNVKISTRLRRYLRSIPKELRNTYTCNNQKPWYRYKAHPAPKILFSAGFVVHGPKFLRNDVGAIAIGAVYGIHSDGEINSDKIIEELSGVCFEKRVVHHAKILKKVEVGQMNTMLRDLGKLSI